MALGRLIAEYDLQFKPDIVQINEIPSRIRVELNLMNLVKLDIVSLIK